MLLLTKRFVERKLRQSMTGRAYDLERRIGMPKSFADVGVRSFLNAFAQDSHDTAGLFQLFFRLGKEASPRSEKKLLRNLIGNWGLERVRIRDSRARRGIHAQSHIVIGPTMHCRGCHSGLYSNEGGLSERKIGKVFREARHLAYTSWRTETNPTL
jgi:hypothetical protein